MRKTTRNNKASKPEEETPAREKWLYKNKAALASVRRGLKHVVEGQVVTRGSFAQYAK